MDFWVLESVNYHKLPLSHMAILRNKKSSGVKRRALPDGAERPLVSIVTPSLDSEAFIEETILSVAGQTYPNVEYIVVDGGSTDGTVDIIKKHEASISRWLSEPDGGQGDALRKGFALAAGDVLAWINADDAYPPDAIESAVDALVRTDADVVYGHFGTMDAEGRETGIWRHWPFMPYFSRHGIPYLIFPVSQPSAFWTRRVYEQVGGIDSSYLHSMDIDLMTRFAMSGARFRLVRKCLVRFRFHPAQKTARLKPELHAEVARVVAGLPKRSFLHLAALRLVLRAWCLLCDIRDGRGPHIARVALRICVRRFRRATGR